MSVTMREIADTAQVSVSTVSRVLSGHPAISERRVKEILSVANKLNYRRRPLPIRRSDPIDVLQDRTIAIITLGMSRRLLALPAVARAINGAEETLSSAGTKVLLRHIPQVEKRLDIFPNEFDGVILFGALQGDVISNCREWFFEHLQNIPMVWMLGRPAGTEGDVVLPHAFDTGCRAAEYLIQHGHRELAFLNPKPDHLQFMAREDGFVTYARRNGASVQAFCEAPEGGWPLPLQPPTDVKTVQKLVDSILSATPRPTAIFTAADSIAALTYHALTKRSVRIGEEISIISANNDESWIAALHPGLTTFDIHAEQIGQIAVRRLAYRLSEPENVPPLEVTVKSTLVERESVVKLS